MFLSLFRFLLGILCIIDNEPFVRRRAHHKKSIPPLRRLDAFFFHSLSDILYNFAEGRLELVSDKPF